MGIIDDALVPLLGISAIQNVKPLAELAPQGLLGEGASIQPQRKRRVEAVVMMQKAEPKVGRPREISCSTHLRERARRHPPILDESQWMEGAMEL